MRLQPWSSSWYRMLHMHVCTHRALVLLLFTCEKRIVLWQDSVGLAHIKGRVSYWRVQLSYFFPRLLQLTAVRWNEVLSGPLVWPSTAAVMLEKDQRQSFCFYLPQISLIVYALFLWCSRDNVFLEANECLGSTVAHFVTSVGTLFACQQLHYIWW